MTNNIFAIGDSHCIYYYDSPIIKNHWVGWGSMPVTIYQLVEKGLPLYNIVEKMPPGDICNINIKENDYVLFSYGWNDVQKNIHKYSKNDYKAGIKSLISQYINLIKKYSDGTLFKIKPIVNCVYPIPLSMNDTIIGSDTDRIIYTKYMNKQLEKQCLQNNISFFNIYDLVSDNNKLNINVVDKDMTHLDRKNVKLRQTIENKLMSICNKYYIYFNNWWDGFFTKRDGNHIGFFEKLLSFTSLKNFEITTDINKASVLIEAGKPDPINKTWKYKMNFIGEPVFPDHDKYDIVLSGVNRIPNIVDLPVSVMYMLGNNSIPKLLNRPKRSIPPFFCCFIVSNPKCKERNKMFEMLNTYKKVNSGGRYANNIGHIINPSWWSQEFLDYISKHKFMICFENTKMETYSTEKIVNAYLGHTIPIYWSTDNIHNIFNPESMLFLNNETDEEFKRIVESVIELDNNDEKYLEFVNRPVFNEHNIKFWEKNYSFEGLGKKIDNLLFPPLSLQKNLENRDITLFITSCGRMDLLRTTLTSFVKFNTYPIKEAILCEDSGIKGCADFVKDILPFPIKFCYNDERIGQMKTIEKYITLVNTPYIFHLEDDYEFFDYGFIELSLKILDSDPKISQVLLEDEQHDFFNMDIGNSLCLQVKTNNPNGLYSINANNGDGALNVFSWRPSLKKMEVALLRVPYQPWDDEYTIELEINKRGYYAVITKNNKNGKKGFCTHIGKNRHIESSKKILGRKDFPDKINIRLKDI